jgi:dolichol kinase
MGAFFLFVCAEIVRVQKIKPLAAHIDGFVKEYVDSRDQGVLILTHIYLLCGCAIPLWILFPKEIYSVHEIIVWMSGVVSLGIGDSMVRAIL